jgi:hypothetical protein
MAAESHPEPALATVAAEDALATVAAEDALATGVVADEAAVRPKRPELPPGMSRNAFKKMLKDQKWVEGRGERRCAANPSAVVVCLLCGSAAHGAVLAGRNASAKKMQPKSARNSASPMAKPVLH